MLTGKVALTVLVCSAAVTRGKVSAQKNPSGVLCLRYVLIPAERLFTTGAPAA